MGFPMAANLLKAGLEIDAYDISLKRLEAAKKLGMDVKDSPNNVVQNIDALITMLPNDSAVKGVFIDGDLLQNLDKKVLIIESSTISPNLAKMVAHKAHLNELSFLDAPVSGGVKGAELGVLTFIVEDADLILRKPLIYLISWEKILFMQEIRVQDK